MTEEIEERTILIEGLEEDGDDRGFGRGFWSDLDRPLIGLGSDLPSRSRC